MYKNILVPILFDDHHDSQASFLVAKALAGEGAKVTVVHVLENLPGYAATYITPDILAKMRHDTQQALDTAANAIPGAKTALLQGNAGRQIVDFAADNGVDCIVMRGHKPGLADLLLGSTADRVVRHAKCSVHVIR